MAEIECGVPLEADEAVARCAIFPRFVADGAFSFEQLLSVGPPITKGVYALSVASQSILASPSEVHGYGCRVAQTGNDRFTTKHGRPPRRPDESVHYFGFYNLNVGAVCTIDDVYYRVSVVHWPDDEKAHCHLQFSQTAAEGTRRAELATARTILIGRVARLLDSPQDHTCDCDLDVADWREKFTLPQPPGAVGRLTIDFPPDVSPATLNPFP